MYTIRNLIDVSIEELAATHNLAFSDYVVPMKSTPEQLETYYKIVGVDLNLSFGAFCENKLIGIIANAIDPFKGETVAWDAMTCIVKEHRGKGLFSKLFESTGQSLKDFGISQYYLDVITSNTKAYLAYKNKGMEIVRELVVLTGRASQISVHDADVTLSPLSSHSKNEVSLYQPSFQNRMIGLRRASQNYLVAKHGNVEIVMSKEGRINQIKYGGQRDMESLSKIFACLSGSYENMDISNIPLTENELLDALMQIGFTVKVNQYEMRMSL